MAGHKAPPYARRAPLYGAPAIPCQGGNPRCAVGGRRGESGTDRIRGIPSTKRAKTPLIVPIVLNDTTWKYTSGGVGARLPDASNVQATVLVDDKTFNSNCALR